MAARKGGLNAGRGLESLIPQNSKKKSEASANKKGAEKSTAKEPEVKIVEKVVEKVVETPVEQYLKLSEIVPNKEQPRKDFDEPALDELAESIKKYGVLQPIMVQKKGRYYEILAGERRYRAAKKAGLKKVPVIIREYTPQESMEIALIENIQRENLNPIEEAVAYKRLIEEFSLKQEDLAARVSKNRSTITNAMRLLKLEESVQNLLAKGKLSAGHARALLALESPEMQTFAAEQILIGELSVREAEKLVKRMLEPKKEKTEEAENPQVELAFKAAEEKLTQIAGTKVSIVRKKRGKGKIEIEYYSQDELDRLLELFDLLRAE